MAKDTEKLIRQLSLISYLMAERRPVTAPEIRRDVEGYSVMNEDAFARRFYADRSELEALGIVLAVEKPIDGLVEQENYSLPPENFHLPAIAFTDAELAALNTALHLLDGEFAYAEPLRLALQQISWGRPSPLNTPEQSTVALGITGSAGGHDVSHRLAKIETAIFRRKTIVFEYHTMERETTPARAASTPTSCSSPGAASSTSSAALARAQRDPGLPPACGSAARSATPPRPSTTSSGPTNFDLARLRRQPDRLAVRRAARGPPRCGSAAASPGRSSSTSAATARSGPPAEDGHGGDLLFVTPYANARQLIAWVLGLGENARVVGPPALVDQMRERVAILVERHSGEPQVADAVGHRRRSGIRPLDAAGEDGGPPRSPGGAAVNARARTQTATVPTPPSGPSASPGSSRWPAS